jgi:REP-associated tyrosine transposase
MPRIARAVAIDFPHHITQRGNNRAPIFFDDEDRHLYCETLSRYSKQYHLEIWAYCLMGNHVHLLAVPRKADSMAKGIGLTNLVYTQYINRKLRNSGRIWQNRFFSCAVQKESYLWSVARYIEQNPVKARLTERAEEYPWSSAKAHLLGMPDDLLSKEWLEISERRQYAVFVSQVAAKDDELIRKATSTGKPLGNDEFVSIIEIMLGCKFPGDQPGRPKVYK